MKKEYMLFIFIMCLALVCFILGWFVTSLVETMEEIDQQTTVTGRIVDISLGDKYAVVELDTGQKVMIDILNSPAEWLWTGKEVYHYNGKYFVKDNRG